MLADILQTSLVMLISKHMGIGAKQRERAESAGIKQIEVCVEAGGISTTTLSSFYKDLPSVQPEMRARIIAAIDRLEARKAKAAG